MLFALIYAGKTIHEHELHQTVFSEEGIVATNGAVRCSICEFQLTRDLEYPVVPEEQTLFFTTTTESVFPFTLIFSSIDLQQKDRAPPVLT